MDRTPRATVDLPLAGMRVLDLSRLLPGPYCSLLLARLGAEVIKVETPQAGDYARMAPAELGFGGFFDALNRGKRSIALDYRRPLGRDLLLTLAETADVFLESSRPGRLERRGLGAADVRARNPGLVYCSISGFGQSGPLRDRPGHDVDYLAVTGVLALLGPAGAAPAPPGLQLADIATGTVAALRILAALLGRASSGQGAYLDVAAVDGPLAWLETLGAAVGHAEVGGGPMRGAYPCYAVYEAGDGRWLAVGALEVPFWQAFCRGLGRPDLAGRQFDGRAVPEVATVIASRPSSEWLERFSADACVALVVLPAEALDDPWLHQRGFGHPAGVPAPRLGADTEEVLAEVGIEPGLLRQLSRSGVISGPQTPERAERAARLGSLLARHARPRLRDTA